MNPDYTLSNGGNGAGAPKWVQEDGVMKQTQPKPGDPTYCAIELDKDLSFCGQIRCNKKRKQICRSQWRCRHY